MQDRPTVDELLGAVERFLREDIVPATDGRRQFLARVAANAIGLVTRELASESAHAAREWAGLDGLLGAEPLPAERAAIAERVRARNQELCERIRAGEFDDDAGREALLRHLRATVRDKLEVTNRAYLDADEGRV
jgi:hypothetical protein